MYFTYTWKYKCGCIAPKLVSDLVLSCRKVSPTRERQLFSYLDVDCTPTCQNWEDTDEQDNIAYLAEKRDNYLYYGRQKGEADYVPYVDWYDAPQYREKREIVVLPYRNEVLPSFAARNLGWDIRKRGRYMVVNESAEEEEEVGWESETESAVFHSRLERRKG